MFLVKISMTSLGRICAARGISMSALLEKAGVSRNAFYSLARKENILPNSIRAVAAHLGVKASEIIEEEDARVAGARVMAGKIDRIVAKHPDVDRDNVRHMLLLLQEQPIERLRRALIRAQKSDIH
mgnify:CR=1 FL=1